MMATWRLGDLATWRLGDLRTCRPADLPTCRPADLRTCRPADLPTCRPADLPNLVAGDHRGAGPFNLLQPHLRWGLNLHLHLQGRAFRPMPCLESTAILPRPHLLPRVSSDIIAQHYLSLVKNPSRRKQRGTPPRQVVNSGSVNIN
jgi:hypothetical protein